jgi:hypothetical protein
LFAQQEGQLPCSYLKSKMQSCSTSFAYNTPCCNSNTF